MDNLIEELKSTAFRMLRYIVVDLPSDDAGALVSLLNALDDMTIRRQPYRTAGILNDHDHTQWLAGLDDALQVARIDPFL